MLPLLLALAPLLEDPAENKGHAVRAPLPSPEEIAALPADGGEEFNRLVHEASPYLLQHARNPVDWYPWGEEAFRTAKEEGKPVFLSVGYSTCHWCHVMEHESFEDDEVAALMNENYICVKVDREERPDIDQVYMTVTQAMTGRGGWPMTVVMTPEKKPYFAGTYFPKNGRFNQPGMMQLLPELARVYREEREKVEVHVEQVVAALAARSGGSPGAPLEPSVLDAGFASLAQRYDKQYGGFGKRPKFPVPHDLTFLLRSYARTGNEEARSMVETTLRRMREGGIFDHVGFGIHRYSTDREWLVPHFEKMLYDQALVTIALVETWQVSGDDFFRRTADEIFTYVLRDMTSPEGGFYSAEDADSEGEEGLFYLWSPKQLAEILGEDDAAFIAEVWNIEEGGNFMDEATKAKNGLSIPHLSAPMAELAAEAADTQAFLARVEAIRAKLFEVREARIHPLKDDKVLTDWNGLMIAALAKAGRAFDEPAYTAAASRAADFVLAELTGEGGRLLKRWRLGQAGLDGMLEDHAFLGWGLLELFETSGDARWLESAIAVTDAAIAHFHDAEGGGFFLSPDDGEDLIVRSKDIYDGALPSGNSVMASNMVRLSKITGRTRYAELADGTASAFSAFVAQAPSNTTQLLCALDLAFGPSYEVVIAGDPAAEDTRAMLRALHAPFLPRKVVVVRPPGQAPLITKLAEYTQEQTSSHGAATAYVCQDHACREPTTETARMLEFLGVTGD